MWFLHVSQNTVFVLGARLQFQKRATGKKHAPIDCLFHCSLVSPLQSGLKRTNQLVEASTDNNMIRLKNHIKSLKENVK